MNSFLSPFERVESVTDITTFSLVTLHTMGVEVTHFVSRLIALAISSKVISSKKCFHCALSFSLSVFFSFSLFLSMPVCVRMVFASAILFVRKNLLVLLACASWTLLPCLIWQSSCVLAALWQSTLFYPSDTHFRWTWGDCFVPVHLDWATAGTWFFFYFDFLLSLSLSLSFHICFTSPSECVCVSVSG